ncbi:MAG: hypothetical protein ABIJ12_13830 [bacterium]
MRETTEVEEKLRNLFRPIGNFVRWIVELWVFCKFGTLLTFFASPILRVWNRYWSFIQGDDIPIETARVPGFLQKATYQRSNAFVVWPLLIGCVAVISLGILSEESSMVTITSVRQPVTIADMYVPEQENVSDARDIPGARTNVPKRVGFGDGFLGFRDLRPVHTDIPEPIDVVQSEIYTMLDDHPFNPEEPVSFSPVEGDMDTTIIPIDADYLFSKFEDTTSKPDLITRGPALVFSVKPDVPFSAEKEGIEGYVEVLALIGPDGNYAYYTAHAVDSVSTHPECILEVVLKDNSKASLEFYIDADSLKNQLMYVKLTENPANLQFAENLFKVLPEWRFAPPLYESKPTYAFIRIVFNFCAPDVEDCVELIILPS